MTKIVALVHTWFSHCPMLGQGVFYWSKSYVPSTTGRSARMSASWPSLGLASYMSITWTAVSARAKRSHDLGVVRAKKENNNAVYLRRISTLFVSLCLCLSLSLRRNALSLQWTRWSWSRGLLTRFNHLLATSWTAWTRCDTLFEPEQGLFPLLSKKNRGKSWNQLWTFKMSFLKIEENEVSSN